MSKGLEALKELRNLCKRSCIGCIHPQTMGWCKNYCYHKPATIVEKELKQYDKLKSHIVEIDNEPDNGDDYYFIVLEKTKEVRELLEKLKEELL